MPSIWDPESGRYVEVENQFLAPQAPYIAPLEISYGKPVDPDIGTTGSQLGVFKDAMELMFDPRVAYMNSVMNNVPTFNYAGLQGEMPWGNTGGGGGGSSDGYSGGGGGDYEIWTTPHLDRLMQSSDPWDQIIAKGVTGNASSTQLKRQLMAAQATPAPGTTPPSDDEMKFYFDEIDKALEEKAGSDRTNLQNQMVAQGPGEKNQLQDYFEGWGTPAPGLYGPGNWPADVQDAMNRFLPPDAQDTRQGRVMQRAARRAKRNAVYVPKATVDASRAAYDKWNAIPRGAGSGGATRIGQQRISEGLSPEQEEIRQMAAKWQNAARRGLGGGYEESTGTTWEGGGVTGQTEGMYGRANIAPQYANNEQGGYWPGRTTTSGYNKPAPNRYLGYDYEVERNGQPMYTNTAGQQYDWLQNQASSYGKVMEQAQNRLQKYVANDLYSAGRTPQRDAMSAQMNFLRSMGVNI